MQDNNRKPTYEDLLLTIQGLTDAFSSAGQVSLGAKMFDANDVLYRAKNAPALWVTVGFDENGKIVSETIEAGNELQAFGLAATKRDSVEWVCAFPASCQWSPPGDSLVHSSTIKEQPEVFGP